ncbi:MAG TPA: hypothetical protein DEA90_00060 [Opitutae bacterium]|nr:hypothetical protein [Puniceicoccaceae bacterium]HBR92541.1 hypothetical protein [Opitutae bacterium]|tara:strand:- start:11069 stop:11701 length:633 start_codon:yes stop_codon:yes gene_type:complete
MPPKPTNVDEYLKDGCGRCALGGTPDCKVHPWAEVLRSLRAIVLQTELVEVIKWGAPCYTYAGKNVLILGALKESVVLSFFRGSEMKDTAAILDLPGENTRFARCIRFKNTETVASLEEALLGYVAQAIEIEKSGKAVSDPKLGQPAYPQELIEAFEQNSDFKAAFAALTPGRQRGYLLYFTSAKQSKTKAARIEKCMPKVFSGKGWNER